MHAGIKIVVQNLNIDLYSIVFNLRVIDIDITSRYCGYVNLKRKSAVQCLDLYNAIESGSEEITFPRLH